jgi:hypothetical protein
LVVVVGQQDLAIEVRDDALDVVALEGRYVERPDERQHVARYLGAGRTGRHRS